MQFTWAFLIITAALIPFLICAGFGMNALLQLCLQNSGCAASDICKNYNCINACKIQTCGIDAYCLPHNHSSSCECRPNYIGDPMINCTKRTTRTDILISSPGNILSTTTTGTLNNTSDDDASATNKDITNIPTTAIPTISSKDIPSTTTTHISTKSIGNITSTTTTGTLNSTSDDDASATNKDITNIPTTAIPTISSKDIPSTTTTHISTKSLGNITSTTTTGTLNSTSDDDASATNKDITNISTTAIPTISSKDIPSTTTTHISTKSIGNITSTTTTGTLNSTSDDDASATNKDITNIPTTAIPTISSEDIPSTTTTHISTKSLGNITSTTTTGTLNSTSDGDASATNKDITNISTTAIPTISSEDIPSTTTTHISTKSLGNITSTTTTGTLNNTSDDDANATNKDITHISTTDISTISSEDITSTTTTGTLNSTSDDDASATNKDITNIPTTAIPTISSEDIPSTTTTHISTKSLGNITSTTTTGTLNNTNIPIQNFDDVIFNFQTKLIQETNCSGGCVIFPHESTIMLLTMILGAHEDTKKNLSSALNINFENLTFPLSEMASSSIKAFLNQVRAHKSMQYTVQRRSIFSGCDEQDQFSRQMQKLGVDVTYVGPNQNTGDSVMEFLTEGNITFNADGIGLTCRTETRRKNLATPYFLVYGLARNGKIPKLNDSQFFEWTSNGSDRGSNNISLILIRPPEEVDIRKRFSELKYADFSKYETQNTTLEYQYTVYNKTIDSNIYFWSKIMDNRMIDINGTRGVHINGDFNKMCNLSHTKTPVLLRHEKRIKFTMDPTRLAICPKFSEIPVQTILRGGDVMLFVSNKSILMAIICKWHGKHPCIE